MTRSLGVLALVIVLLAGCAPSPAPATLTLNGVSFTEPEFKYGLNVHPDASVKLADDVVLVANGAQAIRSTTGDGFTWVLDPRAPDVERLQVGKVMFLTGRAVGRVVDVTPIEAGLAVSIAPVDITEVITEGSFGGSDIAFDESQMIAYDTGPVPWSVIPMGPSADASGSPAPGPSGGPSSEPSPAPSTGSVARLANFRPGGSVADDRPVVPAVDEYDPGDVSQRPPPPNPNWGGASPATVGDWSLKPECCANGVGVSVSYDKDGLRLKGSLKVVGSTPKASWHLDISGGKIQRAGISIAGAAGIAYSFDAATADLFGNLNQRIELPVSLSMSFPAVAGIPFTFSLTQSLLIATAFSSKNAHLAASGRWMFGGNLGFEYNAGGSVQPAKPSGVTTERSMLSSMDGAAVGPMGIVLAHRLEARVGIGASFFSVGPYVDLTSSLGASRGSDIGIVVCKGVDLNMITGAGASYRLPAVVVKIVNFFLKPFKITPIKEQGDLVRAEVPILHASATVPASKICH